MHRGAQASICRVRAALAATGQRGATRRAACLIQLCWRGDRWWHKVLSVDGTCIGSGTHGRQRRVRGGKSSLAGWLWTGHGVNRARGGCEESGPGLPECVQILIASLQDPSLVCWTREEEGWLLNQPHDPSIPCAIFSRLSSSMLGCRPSRLCSAVWKVWTVVARVGPRILLYVSNSVGTRSAP